jgi:hypothetical protein
MPRVFLLKIAYRISQFVPEKWQLMGSAMVLVPLWLQRNCVPDTDRLEDQEDLIGDFTDAAEAIAVIIHAEDVVNNVLYGP